MTIGEYFFKLIFDYMLEGMPCDRVNQIIENRETMITWETTRDFIKLTGMKLAGISIIIIILEIHELMDS